MAIANLRRALPLLKPARFGILRMLPRKRVMKTTGGGGISSSSRKEIKK
jgi:hypothetical protein